MIQLRGVEARDAESVSTIYNEGIEDRGATFETRLRSVSEIGARIADTRYPLLVATRSDDTVVGWAGLSSYRDRPCYAGIAEFSIYLARTARGQGVGRLLLNGLVERASAAGYWKLVSRVFPFNTASRALCRACGFREVGIYEKHAQLDDRWLDVVIVERLIPENLAAPRSGAAL